MNQTLSMNYALQNEHAQHLGFLLMVADEAEPNHGACLIRAMPESQEMEHHPMVKALQLLQEMGELRWAFDTHKTILTQADKTEVALIQNEHLRLGQYSYQLIDMMGFI